MIKDIYRLLLSGRVRRWHTHPHMRDCGEQNAEHQWTTAMIALTIEPELSREALINALTHDAGEMGTMDVPYSFKCAEPEIAESLRPYEYSARRELIGNVPVQRNNPARAHHERLIVKCADYLAGYGVMVQHQPWLRFEIDWVWGLDDTRKMLRTLSSDHKHYHRISGLINSWHGEAEKRDGRSF